MIDLDILEVDKSVPMKLIFRRYEMAILLSETASNDATNPRSRILIISKDDPRRNCTRVLRGSSKESSNDLSVD